LDVITDIQPHALDAWIPNLILQPLVENAVKHGFERNAKNGKIVIHARKEELRLVLEVRDNGKGLKENGCTFFSGLGLANSKARLDHLYGKEAALDLISLNEECTQTRVSILRHKAISFLLQSPFSHLMI
ncbi:MAG: ATP-binding protein, partial [Planctomycetota bacterium]